MKAKIFKDYAPSPIFKNNHINTVYPSLFRKVEDVHFYTERTDTKDGDFIYLNRVKNGSKKLIILMHGLEGNGSRQYIKGMARTFINKGWDAMALTYRGCSGQDNDTEKTYHGGFCDDLDDAISKVQDGYEKIAIVGFSLGGNITLKYLGDPFYEKSAKICAGVAVSVPCDLKSATHVLEKKSNTLYSRRFLKTLKRKMEVKSEKFPDKVDSDRIASVGTIKDFDDFFTAPLHGFKDAYDYYENCSCKSFLTGISVPSLIINALDDPFLSPECYPFEECEKNDKLSLLTPKYGGHVGFSSLDGGDYWSEQAAFDFVSYVLNENKKQKER